MIASYYKNLTDRAAELEVINFEVAYIPDSASFIALSEGDDWNGLSGHGNTPRKALLELIDAMTRSLAPDAE